MMESKELAFKTADVLNEKKAYKVAVIDISLKSSFADYFVMASAGNERQLQSLKDSVEDALEPLEIFSKSIEGRKSSGWILMDYGDVVINIMTAETREKYNLEKIWGDCEILEIN